MTTTQEKAELGVDGNCGFALLGPNIQKGEVEFVEVPPLPANWVEREIMQCELERQAAHMAFFKLRERLKRPDLSYWFGPSHPYGD